MLEQLLQGIQGAVGQELQDKVGVDSGMVSQIIKVAGSVATKEVGQEMVNGGLENVMNLFSNNTNNTSADSLQSNITSGVISSLMDKLGFDNGKASMITSMVLPAIMSVITNKNNETPAEDSSPIESLFGGDTGGMVKGLLGGLFK